LPADVDHIVFNFLRAKLSVLAFRLVASNRIGSFEIKTCVEQTFQDAHPRFIFAMVKREGQYSTAFQNSMGLPPAVGQQSLIKSVRILGLSRRVGHHLKCFWRKFTTKKLWILIFENKPQPHIKIVGKFSVLEQISEWW